MKARKTIYFLLYPTENIRAKLEHVAPLTVNIGIYLEWLQAVNNNLSAIKQRFESEISFF